jgi:integral membrane sensor domain MASE1
MTALVTFAALCAASAWLGLYFPAPVPAAPMFALWAPSGVLLAALIRAETRAWPQWLAVGLVVLSTVLRVDGMSWSMAAGTAALTVAEAAAAAALLRRTTEGSFTMTRVAHVIALVIVAATVPLVSGLAAAAGISLVNDVPFFIAWRGWWFGAMLGLLLFGALGTSVIAGAAGFVDRVEPRPLLELMTVLAAAAFVAWLVFGEGAPAVLRVPAYALPLLLWAAFRLEPGGAIATLLAVCLVGLEYTSRGFGPLVLPGSFPGDWILRSQGSLATAGVSIMLLASAVSERRQTARERTVLLGELQRALAEIKTLQDLIPICAWCQKVRDDAGFWQGIEGYLRTHTDATFSHSICPECTRGMERSIAEQGGEVAS